MKIISKHIALYIFGAIAFPIGYAGLSSCGAQKSPNLASNNVDDDEFSPNFKSRMNSRKSANREKIDPNSTTLKNFGTEFEKIDLNNKSNLTVFKIETEALVQQKGLGEVIVCSGSEGKLESIELRFQYESRVKWGYPPIRDASSSSRTTVTLNLINDIKKLNSRMAEKLSRTVEQFSDGSFARSLKQIAVEMPSYQDLPVLPKNCEIQIAIFPMLRKIERDPQFIVNEDLFSLLSETQKSLLILIVSFQNNTNINLDATNESFEKEYGRFLIQTQYTLATATVPGLPKPEQRKLFRSSLKEINEPLPLIINTESGRSVEYLLRDLVLSDSGAVESAVVEGGELPFAVNPKSPRVPVFFRNQGLRFKIDEDKKNVIGAAFTGTDKLELYFKRDTSLNLAGLPFRLNSELALKLRNASYGVDVFVAAGVTDASLLQDTEPIAFEFPATSKYFLSQLVWKDLEGKSKVFAVGADRNYYFRFKFQKPLSPISLHLGDQIYQVEEGFNSDLLREDSNGDYNIWMDNWSFDRTKRFSFIWYPKTIE